MTMKISRGYPSPVPPPRPEFKKEEKTGVLSALQQNRDQLTLSDQEGKETESVGGKVGFNAAKRARQLAAAKTEEQVRAVLALLQEDLEDCEAGLAQGMCDQAEVDKVKALIRQAQQRLGQVGGREEATPAEEAAFAIASLM